MTEPARPEYEQALMLVRSAGEASAAVLQRVLGVTYGNAVSMMDRMEREGTIGPANGGAPRPLLRAVDNPTEPTSNNSCARPQASDAHGAPNGRDVAGAAQKYALRGWPVFPVVPQGKRPLTAHGLKDATTDARQIGQWWQEHPDANVGVAVPVGIMVLDVDGDAGRASLAALEGAHGLLPPTLTVRTGGGGEHRWFKLPGGQDARCSAGKLGAGLDVRAQGGYVIAPPSVHASGRRYEWIAQGEPAPVPGWLLALSAESRPPSSPPAASAEVPKGQRHSHLVSQAGTMRRKGLAPAAIEAALLAENKARCAPPMPDSEVIAIARDVCGRYRPGVPRPTLVAEKPGVVMANVRPEPLSWLWPGRIPAGKLTVLDGDPGLGKTTILLDLAARITTGRPMPDGATGRHGGVVVATAEDDLGDTIRPRLDAAGADCSRVVALPVAQFSNIGELEVLRAAIQQNSAVLVIVDPLMAYLGTGAECNSWRDQDVRRALAPLAALASETRAAIVLIRHLRKSSDSNPLYRGGGSIGIIGAARAGLLVARDPDDSERRVLAVAKSNLAREAPSLSYRMVEQDGAPCVEWLGSSPHDAAGLLAIPASAQERSEVAEAEDWLLERLAAGPVPAKEVQRNAVAAGIAGRTLARAKGRLGIASGKRGYSQGWYWALPPKDANRPKGANTGALASFAETSVNTGPAAKDAKQAEIDRQPGNREQSAAPQRAYVNGSATHKPEGRVEVVI